MLDVEFRGRHDDWPDLCSKSTKKTGCRIKKLAVCRRMSESHAISALKRKRAELAGELLDLEKRRRAITCKIRHGDEALKLMGFSGDPKDMPARRYSRRLFPHGELQRIVFAALRESGGSISNAKIAALIVRQMGWDTGDEELRSLVAGKVKDARKRFNKLTADS